MRQIPSLICAALVTVFLSGNAALAQQCTPPVEGDWLLSTERTKTIGGPGAPGSVRPFSLKVEGCGETLVFNNLGETITGNPKRFKRIQTNPAKYLYSTILTMNGVTVTLVINAEQQDRTTMTADWLLGTFATTHGTMTKVAPFESARSDRGLCECKAFIDRLRGRVSDAENWISIYQAPKYIQRPPGLAKSLAWNSIRQNELLNLVEIDGHNFDDAVRNIVDLTKARRRSTSTSSNEPGTGHAFQDAEAVTNPYTCEVSPIPTPTGCAGDIVRDSVKAHENTHQSACLAQNAKRSSETKTANNVPSYAILTGDPANSSLDEVAAYTAEINSIKDAYQNLCGKPLP